MSYVFIAMGLSERLQAINSGASILPKLIGIQKQQEKCLHNESKIHLYNNSNYSNLE